MADHPQGFVSRGPARRQRGDVLIWAVASVMLIAGIVFAAHDRLRGLDRLTEAEFSTYGQAHAIAQAGLTDAVAWLRRASTQPVVALEPARDPSLPARDLVVWRSEPFPSHAQILAIADPVERANVVMDPYARFGFDFAWDANQPVDSAFFALDGTGAVAATPTPAMRIDEDEDVSDRGRRVYASIQLARTEAESFHRRAVFTRDPAAAWVPNGFELKVAGASGSRKVWIHLVVEALAYGGLVLPQSSTVIASTKDL